MRRGKAGFTATVTKDGASRRPRSRGRPDAGRPTDPGAVVPVPSHRRRHAVGAHARHRRSANGGDEFKVTARKDGRRRREDLLVRGEGVLASQPAGRHRAHRRAGRPAVHAVRRRVRDAARARGRPRSSRRAATSSSRASRRWTSRWAPPRGAPPGARGRRRSGAHAAQRAAVGRRARRRRRDGRPEPGLGLGELPPATPRNPRRARGVGGVTPSRRRRSSSSRGGPSATRRRRARSGAAPYRLVSAYVEDATRPEAVSVAQIIASKKGDCTEHATLLVALARAVGGPRAPSVGAHVPGRRRARLRSPRLGRGGARRRLGARRPDVAQTEIDAAHVTLQRGEGGAASLETSGKLHFKVRELERAK